MATTISNVRTVDCGGGLREIFGNFTTTVGSAPFTYATTGMPLLWQVNPLSTVGTGTASEPFDPTLNVIAGISVSGAIVTLTIQGGTSAVTNGTFYLKVSVGG